MGTVAAVIGGIIKVVVGARCVVQLAHRPDSFRNAERRHRRERDGARVRAMVGIIGALLVVLAILVLGGVIGG
jgi:amino acid transporter